MIWLHGTAGVGKSAVAFTVAERMKGLKVREDTKIETRLAGTFFFSRKHTKRSTTGHFFATLAYQLASNFPSVQRDVNRAIRENPAVLDSSKSLRDQMKALFRQPLLHLQLRLRECPPPVFVIDALDECKPETVADLISLLGEALRDRDLPVFHILLTSRLEAHIRQAIHNEDMRALVYEIPVNTSGEGVAGTISLDGEDVDNDICIFLRHSFTELRSRRPNFPQPSAEKLARLANRAGRRFIVASTMMKFVDDGYNDPRDRLELMLELTNDLLPGTEVHKLYDRILATCSDPDRAYQHLSIVTALADPLPISQISELLGDGQGSDVATVLVQLRSLMDIPADSSQPVNIYHSSIRDYASDLSNCSLQLQPIIMAPHSLLAYSSFHLMIQDIPEHTALLDALLELKSQNQAMEFHDPKSLQQSLAFIVEPPAPLHVLTGLLWLRGARGSGLRSWLESLDGRAWLKTQGGEDYLRTQKGKDWLQTRGGGHWLQTHAGDTWLHTERGREWLQSGPGWQWTQRRRQFTEDPGEPMPLEPWNGRDSLETISGQGWLETLSGREWLQTQTGEEWLQTQTGGEWLQSRRGEEWLQTSTGQVWLQHTSSGRKWLQTQRGQEWLRVEGGQEWLQAEGGREWLQTSSGREWLQSHIEWLQGHNEWLQTTPGREWLQRNGREWLDTESGQQWLDTESGQEWLQTQSGRAWVETQHGRVWLRTQRGSVWLGTPGGRVWLKTPSGRVWQEIESQQEWLETESQQERLETVSERMWLGTENERIWLGTESGRMWLETENGILWLETESGRMWLETESGRMWLETESGRMWLETSRGWVWLETESGRVWLETSRGWVWLETESGRVWLGTSNGRVWLGTSSGRMWLETESGRAWLRTKSERERLESGGVWTETQSERDRLQSINQQQIPIGHARLHTFHGREWLMTQDGREWLLTRSAEEWLLTPGGQKWLQTPGGGEWLKTPGGLQTQSGREWLKTSHGQAWQLTPAASVWMTMEDFSNTLKAISECAIVPQLHLPPAFQAIQEFKSLPDYLMFPAFLALRPHDHATSASLQDCPDIEAIHAMAAFAIFASEARKRSQSTSDALKYACQIWAVHLSHAQTAELEHIFKLFWNRCLLAWLERQWCLKGLRSCIAILSEGQKFANLCGTQEHDLIEAAGSHV